MGIGSFIDFGNLIFCFHQALFDKHMLAGAQGIQDHRHMQVVGRDDEYGFNVLSVQKFSIGERIFVRNGFWIAADRFNAFFEIGRINVRDHGAATRFNRAQVFQMIAPLAARTNEPIVHGVH